MKKIFLAAGLITTICSCNSSDTDGSVTADTTNSYQPAIPNVNGNIPDTTNSISLDSDKKDTTGTAKDSTR